MQDREGTPESDLGPSGSLPRTNTDTDSDDGASRLNKNDASSFAKPRNAGSTTDDEADTAAGSRTGSGSSKKKSPGVPRAKDDEEGNDGARRAPTISIDEKVAWRAAPVRTRMGVKTTSASARLVRLPAYPKSEWLPVDGDSKIAKN